MTTTLLARPARPVGTVRLSHGADLPRGGGGPAPVAPHRPTEGNPAAKPDLELSADLPLHVLVTRAQRAERAGSEVLWLTGPNAAAAASRLLRLTRTLAIGAELDLAQGAHGAALDAVALAQIGGPRARVLVSQARHLRELARELGLRPRARVTRFGGDAFAAALPPSGHQEVQVTAVVTHQGDLVDALPVARAVRVVAPSGVDAHVLVRRARAAGEGWPDVAVHVAVPAGQRPAAWPHADGVVVVDAARAARRTAA